MPAVNDDYDDDQSNVVEEAARTTRANAFTRGGPPVAIAFADANRWAHARQVTPRAEHASLVASSAVVPTLEENTHASSRRLDVD